MRIDYPTPEQIPQLRLLWQEAFGDEDAFLDHFFSTAFSPDRCLAVQVDGQVAAALYWIDCRLEGTPVAYLYAVATAKAFRGRGICRALMDRTRSLLSLLGYAGILLVPGSEELRHMYAAMGYETATTVKERDYTAEAEPLPLTPITGGEYSRLRRNYLPAGSVLQESCPAFLEGCYRLYAGENCLLAAAKTDQGLFCPEYLGDTKKIPDVLCALGAASGRIRMPGADTPFAMWLPLGDTPAPKYFAFAFD